MVEKLNKEVEDNQKDFEKFVMGIKNSFKEISKKMEENHKNLDDEFEYLKKKDESTRERMDVVAERLQN